MIAERIVDRVSKANTTETPSLSPDEPVVSPPLSVNKLDVWQQGSMYDILTFVQEMFNIPTLTLELLVHFLKERNLHISVEHRTSTEKSGGFIVEASEETARIGLSPEVPSSNYLSLNAIVAFKFFENHGNEIFPSWKSKLEKPTIQS